MINENIGTLIEAAGSEKEQALNILGIVKTKEFIDNRIIYVIKTEKDKYLLRVENPENSDRAKKTEMFLTKESLIGLIATIIVYDNQSGDNLFDKVEQIIDKYEFEGKFAGDTTND